MSDNLCKPVNNFLDDLSRVSKVQYSKDLSEEKISKDCEILSTNYDIKTLTIFGVNIGEIYNKSSQEDQINIMKHLKYIKDINTGNIESLECTSNFNMMSMSSMLPLVGSKLIKTVENITNRNGNGKGKEKTDIYSTLKSIINDPEFEKTLGEIQSSISLSKS